MWTALAAVAALVAPQDLQFTGGKVWTGTEQAWTGPLVVAAGKIAAPGTAAPAGARTVDLHGAFVMPGLQDAHGHVLGLGNALAEIDLVGCKTYAEVVRRVAKVAASTPKGQWLIGRGWDQNLWPKKELPHHADLSAEIDEHPVCLTRVDGHALLLNMQGLFKSGVTRETRAPEGGEILHDEDGNPTGVLVDAAMQMVNLPDPSVEEVRKRWLAAQDVCVRFGLTCVHDAGVPGADLDELEILDRTGKWHLRTWVMLTPNDRERIQRGPRRSKDGLVRIGAVKAYADGALGSRGAALLQPYADRPNWKGLMTHPKAELQQLAQNCADAGMQLCVHAIGDAANRAVLDAIAAVRFPHGGAAARFRIEHAQVVAADDFARFQALGVIPSMQPTHLTSDMPWAPARLGPERLAGAYAWKSFLKLGLPLAFGSDFPVESADPRLGLFAACTTQAPDGTPAAGFRPEQKLDRAQALRGFTRDAAYAMFAEDELGTIAPGHLADLTVFDRDLLTCSDAELLQAMVLFTVVNGRVVYEAGGK